MTTTPSPRRGSVTRRGSRWRARVRISGRLVPVGTFDTEAEAWAAINTLLAVADAQGVAAAAAEHTLGGYAAKVLERRELGGKVRAWQRERSVVESHLLPDELALLPLDVITPRDVRQWVERLARKPITRVQRTRAGVVRIPQPGTTLSHQTVKHALRMLRAVFTRAIRDDLIETNPAMVDVREEMPSTDRTEETWTYLTADEIVRVTRSKALAEADRLLYTVAIYTGLRQGELWGLHWADVLETDDHPELVVRYSRTDATKGGQVRRVPLFTPAAAAMARLRELAGEAAQAEGALVFPSSTGAMRRQDDENGWFDTAESARHVQGPRVVVQRPGHKTLAGITREVRFHDLRHTCASHLLSGSWGRPWRLEEVQKMLGHSDVSTTQRYAHLTPDALHSAAAVTRGVTKHSVPISQLVENTGRAMQDSNLRPTAPEGVGNACDTVYLASIGHALVTLADLEQLQALSTEALRRIAKADPFAITAATKLAEKALDVSSFALLSVAAAQTTGGGSSGASAGRRKRSA